MTPKLLLLSGGGIKSIPMSQLPAEAWRYLVGGQDLGDGTLARYEDVPWLYRGVNVRCEAIAGLPRCFMVNGEESEEYEPPFELDLTQFLNEIEGDQVLFGASYWSQLVNLAGVVRDVRRFHPSTIQPQYDEEKGLVGFKRKIGSSDAPYKLDEIGYLWQPNRKHEVGPGAPPAVAALKAAGALIHIDLFAERFFGQGTIAPLIIGIEGDTGDEDQQRIESWFKRRLTGIRNAFGAVAVRGGIQIHQVGQNEMDKLAMPELTDKKREDIATALGVPHSILFSNATNYATAQQDDLHFYEKTVKPEAQRIEAALNRQLFRKLGVELKFKPEKLEIYQALEAEKAYKLVVFYDRKAISKNELREQAGFEPIPGGDEIEEEAEQVIHDNPGDEDYLDEDMRRWRQKALNRLRSGKSLTFTFESKAIQASLRAAIAGALSGCKTPADVRRVFADARRWKAYP